MRRVQYLCATNSTRLNDKHHVCCCNILSFNLFSLFVKKVSKASKFLRRQKGIAFLESGFTTTFCWFNATTANKETHLLAFSAAKYQCRSAQTPTRTHPCKHTLTHSHTHIQRGKFSLMLKIVTFWDSWDAQLQHSTG